MSKRVAAFRVTTGTSEFYLMPGTRVKVVVNNRVIVGAVVRVDHTWSAMDVAFLDHHGNPRPGCPRQVIASIPMVYAVIIGQREVIIQKSWDITPTHVCPNSLREQNGNMSSDGRRGGGM